MIIIFFIIFSIKNLYISPGYLNYYDNNTIHVLVLKCMFLFVIFVCGIMFIKKLLCKLPLKQRLRKKITSDSWWSFQNQMFDLLDVFAGAPIVMFINIYAGESPIRKTCNFDKPLNHSLKVMDGCMHIFCLVKHQNTQN